MNETDEEPRDVEEDAEEQDEPDAGGPLDLDGYGVMCRSFGTGATAKVCLVSRPVTLNQLLRMSKS